MTDSHPIDILVVEDDPLIRRLLGMIFQLHHYRVDFAANGAEAIAFFERGGRSRLILLDLQMPVMDGRHFLRWLEQQEATLRAIPVVLLTAMEAELDGDGRLCSTQQVVAHFRKPISVPKFLPAIEQALQGNDRPAAA